TWICLFRCVAILIFTFIYWMLRVMNLLVILIPMVADLWIFLAFPRVIITWWRRRRVMILVIFPSAWTLIPPCLPLPVPIWLTRFMPVYFPRTGLLSPIPGAMTIRF